MEEKTSTHRIKLQETVIQNQGNESISFKHFGKFSRFMEGRKTSLADEINECQFTDSLRMKNEHTAQRDPETTTQTTANASSIWETITSYIRTNLLDSSISYLDRFGAVFQPKQPSSCGEHNENHTNIKSIEPENTKSETDNIPTFQSSETHQLSVEKQSSKVSRCDSFETVPTLFGKAKYIPFCEEFDGRPVYRSQTISGCIKDLMESRKKAVVQQLYRNATLSDDMSSESSSTSSTASSDNLSESSCYMSNIIPEMENYDIHTPHMVRRYDTRRRMSDAEFNYVKTRRSYDATDKKSEQGTISVTFQYLLMSKRLKVTVNNVRDVPKQFEKDDEKFTKTYVKVCLMPRKGKKQQKTHKVNGIDNVQFGTSLYFSDIALSKVHLLAVRFQVCQATENIFKKRRCVAEALIWMDEVNVVDQVDMIENLQPY